MSDPAITEFINMANEVSVTDAAQLLGIKVLHGDRGQPCPVCGGKDRFSINAEKQAWYCRGSETGGRTGLGLVGYVRDLNLHCLPELLEACSIVLDGAAPPPLGREQTEQERAARQERMDRAAAKHEKERREREEKGKARREDEIRRARGIYFNALTAPHPMDYLVRDYLKLRTGYDMPDQVFDGIRFVAKCTYWQGIDDLGRPISHHVGPAMIAPIVNLESRVVGCHQTWIDLSLAPKFRPDLGVDNKGDPLPTKKMRGSKKGHLIPVCGDMASVRWVGGEGIENTASVAGAEGFREDTFYFAAGDLGNISGPADHSSDFPHPTLTTTDKLGRMRRAKIAGPVPRPDQDGGEAFQLPAHVSELVLLCDGDSEPVATASAMARAVARLSRDGLTIERWWPTAGMDFSDALAAARRQVEHA